ncbi:MAG: ABC transporter substrate-binding protein [Methyloceanibacter sp.]|uniref:ABC transporter substrate-binding protein n=1 Tax=Methyloceanibacter sp. TaxID=1965321 RepID=UPI003D6D0DA4
MRLCLILPVIALLAFGPAVAAGDKTLRMAYDADPTSLDPHEQLASATLQLSHLVFDPLVRFRQDMTLEPRLAKSWEEIDPRTTRFHLRDDVRFHSGRKLTADDVVWTFDRLKRSPDFKALFEPFAAAKAIDETTVDLITKEPYPLVLNLATYIFPMDRAFYSGTDARGQPKDAVVKHGASFASTNVSGTGPFIVTEREQGIRLKLKRFDGYWDKSSPGNLDEIVLTPIKEPATRVAALLAGDVDFITPVPPTDLARIEKAGCCTLVTMPSPRILTFELNRERVEAFKDPRVRRAISYAINREGIANKIMRGFATAAGQLSPPGYAGHDPELAPPYDLAKAKALMKEAGYADGFSVTMMAPNNRYIGDARIAEAVAAMLAKINIKVDLQTLPKAQYWQRFDERAADIMMIGWQSDTQDSANFYEFLVMTPDAATGYGQYNAGNYSNPEVDRLTLATQTMTDAAARAAVLKKIERIVYDDAAILPLQWQHLSWASRENVNIAPVVNVIDMPYLGDLVIE